MRGRLPELGKLSPNVSVMLDVQTHHVKQCHTNLSDFFKVQGISLISIHLKCHSGAYLFFDIFGFFGTLFHQSISVYCKSVSSITVDGHEPVDLSRVSYEDRQWLWERYGTSYRAPCCGRTCDGASFWFIFLSIYRYIYIYCIYIYKMQPLYLLYFLIVFMYIKKNEIY